MHKTIKLIGILLMMQIIYGCSKYNNAEPLDFKELNPIVGSDKYYEALRAYKNSDHAVCFGWWGRSGVSTVGPDMSQRYEGLPDSMDIVSLWGGYPSGPAWEEMQSVRKRKGTKFLMVSFGSGIENLLRKNFPELAKTDLMAAIDSTAKSMNDTIQKYQIDGFDLDYEPDYGDKSIFGDNKGGDVTNDPHTQRLFKALSQYIGPKSGTNTILMIDGQFDVGIEPYINFLAQQSYGSSSEAYMQQRFEIYNGGVLPSKKFIITENMQGNGRTGVKYQYRGTDIGSVLGMAYWNPIQGRKGGFGAYIIETDAAPNGSGQTYPTLRQGIQIQNPAP